MREISDTQTLMQRIEEHLSAQRLRDDIWTEDDSLILLHLEAAVEAARRKGYSAALLTDILKGLFSD